MTLIPRLLLRASLIVIKVMRLQQKRATALSFRNLPEATSTRPQIGLCRKRSVGGMHRWGLNIEQFPLRTRHGIVPEAGRPLPLLWYALKCYHTWSGNGAHRQQNTPCSASAAQSISQHPRQELASHTHHFLVFGSRPPYSAFTRVNNNKNRSLLCCMFPPYTNCNNTEIFM